MTIITVDDLHIVHNPNQRLAGAANIAHVTAGSNASRIIIRCPDRQTDGVRTFRVDDIGAMLQQHGRIREIGVTDGGTIVAAADVCRRRGNLAIWTGPAIGPWAPSDITQRGLGGSETAAVRLAESLAEMDYAVTLYGDFEHPGMCEDILLKHYRQFDPTQHLDVLVGFRDATLFDTRPNADFCALWLEDLAPAEHLTPARANNLDRVCAVTGWHANQVREIHPWLEERQVAACRNGLQLAWFQDDEED